MTNRQSNLSWGQHLPREVISMWGLRNFGFYDRCGQSQCGGQSLQESLSEFPHPEEEKIVGYLKMGLRIVGCGGVSGDVIKPDAKVHLDMDVQTDGVWAWPAYLRYYVDKYHARLPEDFVAHMKNNGWSVPIDLNEMDYVFPPPYQS